MRLPCLIISLCIITGCEKNTDTTVYQGEVIRGSTDCSTPMGFPYIIKYSISQNAIDTFITGSLPPEFNLPGTKILFKIRSTIPASEVLTCDENIIPPIQKSIYDVRSP